MALEQLLQRLQSLEELQPLDSNAWATGHGIYTELTARLGEYAHVIHPDLSSIRSPISADPHEALEGCVAYGKALTGYSIEGDGHVAANGVLSTHPNRPVVMILNTTGAVARSSTDSTATGGSHWVACVALPTQYTTPGGVALHNVTPQIFYIDSYYANRTLPAQLRNVLLNGVRVRTVVSSVHVLPAPYANAQVRDLVDIPQQQDGSDCGFWAVYNALMLVLTGTSAFTQRFLARGRTFARYLRRELPGLLAQAPVGLDEPITRESSEQAPRVQAHGTGTSTKLPRSGLSFEPQSLERLEYRPGQPVYYFAGTARRRGFINTASEKGFRVRLPKPGTVPNEVVFARADELFPRVGQDAVEQGPQIALPQVTQLGPSRPIDKQPTIHRSDSEIEIVNGKPYIRLYMTIPRACPLKDIDPKAHSATAAFKDVQQEPKTGVILAATGANRGMWIGAGRPLRAAKWAQKYIAEHASKAEENAQIAERLENQVRITEEALAKGTGFRGHEAEQLRKQKNLTTGQLKRLALREKQIETSARELETRKVLIPSQKRDALKARDEAAVWRNPLVRSFLCDLAVFDDVVRNAIPEELAKQHDDAIAFNVDRHYEPNQYNIEGDGLTRVRAGLLDHSLITYAYDVEAVDPMTSGEIRDIRELWHRLGIPERRIDVAVWTEGTGFADKKGFSGIADTLAMHYGTWRESLVSQDKRTPSIFVSEAKARIPYYRRLELLNNFLEAYAIVGVRETERFMDEVVGPWATQAEIARLIAEDYDRMQLDQNVKKAPSQTDFAQLREREPYDRAQLAILGAQVEGMLSRIGTGVGVALRVRHVLDFMIQSRPELREMYAKIAAVGQNYSFYVHAQMVLGQYFAVTHNDHDEPQLPRLLVAKAILFHDMEKVNSKQQYGKEGEHHLTVVEMRRYRYFLGSTHEEWNRAIRLVDADPFGDYFKGKIGLNEAFLHITRIGRAMGFSAPDTWARFFVEYHQFYQADFSSYTSASSYYDERGDLCHGLPVFDGWFQMRNKTLVSNGPRFVYSDKDDYEKKYLALAALFTDPKDMLELAVTLEKAIRDQELARRAIKLADKGRK